MVSEGVDIPRLEVGVYASRVKTEMFFRQASGRFVRARGARDRACATLFIPSIPILLRHAASIERTVGSVLRDSAGEMSPGHGGCRLRGLVEAVESSAARVYATVRGGDAFTEEELRRAESAARAAGLPESVTAVQLAYALRLAASGEADDAVAPLPPVPLEQWADITAMPQAETLAAKYGGIAVPQPQLAVLMRLLEDGITAGKAGKALKAETGTGSKTLAHRYLSALRVAGIARLDGAGRGAKFRRADAPRPPVRPGPAGLADGGMSADVVWWALNLAPVPLDADGKPNPTCAFVLVGLASHAAPDGTTSFPSVATLARCTRLSERTVRTALDRLEAEGIIRPSDPAMVAARIPRADKRPQSFDLNVGLTRDSLDDDDIRAGGREPGLAVPLRITA